MAAIKTSVAIDTELLDRAKELLGTTTVRETVHLALLELLKNRARQDEVAALAAMDGLDLADSEIMSGAWRS
jgi:Arc/MetJ family transcription regulator